MNILYICFYSCTNIIRHYDETATFCVPFQILFRRITQSLMFLPYFISWVVVGAFVYNMFNYEFGAVNTLLRQHQSVFSFILIMLANYAVKKVEPDYTLF